MGRRLHRPMTTLPCVDEPRRKAREAPLKRERQSEAEERKNAVGAIEERRNDTVSSLEGAEAPVDFLQRESKLLSTDRPGQAGYHQYGGEESEQRIEESELKKKERLKR